MAVLVACIVLFACGQPHGASRAQNPLEVVSASGISYDVAKLETHITLSVRPQSATWEILSVRPRDTSPSPPGRTEFTLFAVLTYAAADFEAVRKSLQPLTVFGDEAHDYVLRPWFLDCAKSKWAPGSATGMLVRKHMPFKSTPFDKGTFRDGVVYICDETRLILQT